MNGFSADDFFQLFVTNDLLQHFVTQTNLFANQFIEEHPDLPPFSTVRQWVPTSMTENKTKPMMLTDIFVHLL